MGLHSENHLQPARPCELLEVANRRFLEFLSAIKDPRAGRNKLDTLSQPVEQEGRRYSGDGAELVLIIRVEQVELKHQSP